MRTKTKKSVEAVKETLPIWIFIFAVCYAFFHIMPALIDIEIKYKFWVGDLLDLFTPFIMILLIYKLYRLISIGNSGNEIKPSIKAANFLILIGGASFIEGHGMHLAANSIFRHVKLLEGTPLYNFTYFLDETLSHILWDTGVIIVSASLVMIAFSMKHMYRVKRTIILALPAGLFFGFTFFVNAVEGQTVFFMFPISIIFPAGLIYLAKRGKIAVVQNPIIAFFLIGFVISLFFFLVWLVWQGGFPQFSDIGWIE